MSTKQAGLVSAGSVIALINVALLYGLHVLAARMLGAADYGDFAAAIASARILAVAGAMGFPQFCLKELPVLAKNGRWQYCHGLVRASGLAVAAFSLMVSLGLLGLYGAYAFLLGFKDHHLCFVVVLLFVPLIALAQLGFNLLSANGNYLLAMFLDFILLPLISLSLLFVTLINLPLLRPEWLLPGQTPGFWAVLAWGLSWTAGLAIVLFFIFNRLEAILWQAKPFYSFRPWVKISCPFMVNQLLLLGTGCIGLIILELFHFSEGIVGRFSAVMETAGMLIRIIVSANRYYLPRISLKIEQNHHEGLNRVLRGRMGFLSAVAAVYGLVIFGFGKDILSLFGPSYAAAYPALLVMSLGMAITTLCSATSPILQYLDQAGKAVGANLLLLAAMVVINLALDRWLDELGPALAFLTAVLLVRGWQVWYLRDRYGFKVLAV